MAGKFLRCENLRTAFVGAFRLHLILSMIETVYGSVFNQTQWQSNCQYGAGRGLATGLMPTGPLLSISLPPFTAADFVGQLLHRSRQ